MASKKSPEKSIVSVETDRDELQIENAATVPLLQYAAYLRIIRSPLGTTFDNPLKLARPYSFRILTLEPGEADDRLHCALQICNLNDKVLPSYTALSYTWKESEFDRLYIASKRIKMTHKLYQMYCIKHPIWVRGRRLLISTNLRDFLRRFRGRSLPRTLWIDALCINQSDLVERTTQVELMHQIYSRASDHILWIGEQDEYTEHGFALAKKLSSCSTVNIKTGFCTNIKRPFVGKDFQDFSGPRIIGCHDEMEWNSWIRLFLRPVFNRIWVVQEIVAASNTLVMCGGHRIPLDQLDKSIAFIEACSWERPIKSRYHQPKSEPFPLWVIAHIGSVYRYTDGKSLNFTTTLTFGTTEPRDKIYAILGMLCNTRKPNALARLVPDYRKSLAKVYTEAAMISIQGNLNLDALSHAIDLSYRICAGLPSWAADYSDSARRPGPLVWCPRSLTCYYRADGEMTPCVAIFLNDAKVIRLQGYQVCEVVEASQEHPDDLVQQRLLGYLNIAKHIPQKYTSTRESRTEVLWRTLVGNTDIDNSIYPASKGMEEHFQAFVDFLLKGRRTDDCFEKFTAFNLTHERMAGRRLFHTDNHMIGMGPMSLKRGDKIYIVAGSRVPLALRQDGVKENSFILVGDCYVHGIMHGETLLQKGFSWGELFLN